MIGITELIQPTAGKARTAKTGHTGGHRRMMFQSSPVR